MTGSSLAGAAFGYCLAHLLCYSFLQEMVTRDPGQPAGRLIDPGDSMSAGALYGIIIAGAVVGALFGSWSAMRRGRAIAERHAEP